MMKRIAFLAVLLASPAFAQQAPADPVTASYAQLLGEANSRVANLNGQLQQALQAKTNLEAQIGVLQKQVDALKPKAEPTAAPTPAPTETQK